MHGKDRLGCLGSGAPPPVTQATRDGAPALQQDRQTDSAGRSREAGPPCHPSERRPQTNRMGDSGMGSPQGRPPPPGVRGTHRDSVEAVGRGDPGKELGGGSDTRELTSPCCARRTEAPRGAAAATPPLSRWQARGGRGEQGAPRRGRTCSVQGQLCSVQGRPLTSPRLRTMGKFGTPGGLRVPALVPQLTVQARPAPAV